MNTHASSRALAQAREDRASGEPSPRPWGPRVCGPRVWELDLGAPLAGGVAGSPRAWSGSTPALDRVGRCSGGALALALLYEAAEREPRSTAPLVIAAGECVRRGLPTAARATIASRAPLTARFSEGQVGSELGRRLARLTDALVLRGRAEVPGAVLRLAEDRAPELVACPELRGADPRRVHAELARRFGPCATLSIGLAGERGWPVASLAAGGDPPHFVGRGGLGAVLGRLGLKAIAVESAPVDPAPRPELVRALVSSPRLEGRAAGGTLELFAALHARGELESPSGARAASDEQAAELEREISSARGARHGCAGCPTPCGWVFPRVANGGALGARFGATHALGFGLGLARFEDALHLLGRCDELAADAKEIGAGLALLALARERGTLPGARAWGELPEFERWLDELERGEGQGARLAGGAAAIARELGLEDAGRASEGGATRSDVDLATLLAQCVSVRGAEPMRTFPFLASEGGDRARLEALVHPLPLDAGAEDPRSPGSKGRLVWWHENLSAALDATGFCAFSAAGLLADLVCTPDELAEWIAPRALLEAAGTESAGARLLALGEDLALLQRRLDELWGSPPRALPRWARERLGLPGMWDEYRALRGLDERGALAPESWERFERGPTRDVSRLLARRDSAVAGPAPSAPAQDARACAEPRLGRVRLRSSGALARVLGPERELDLALPASLASVLRAAADEVPAARDALWRSGRVLPAVYRAGRRVALEELVLDGDALDLVLVISGGAR